MTSVMFCCISMSPWMDDGTKVVKEELAADIRLPPGVKPGLNWGFWIPMNTPSPGFIGRELGGCEGPGVPMIILVAWPWGPPGRGEEEVIG